MKKPTVLLDVDGVLANMMASLHWEMTSQGYECPEHDKVDRWEFTTLIRDEDSREMVSIILKRRWFWEGLRQYEGAARFVSALRDYGADVVFVTADYTDCDEWLVARKSWLAKCMGSVWSDIIVTHAKQHVRGDVFIDDKPENVAAWQHRNLDGVGLLMTRPWNVSEKGYARMGGFDDDSVRAVFAILSNRATR